WISIRSISPEGFWNSSKLRRNVSVRPRLFEFRSQRPLRNFFRLHRARQRQSRFNELLSGRDFQIAVTGEPRFVSAAALAERFFRRNVTDAAIGQFDREREFKR